MSKLITIPPCRNPFTVIVNGIRYEYNSGEVVEVPDEVAEVIQFHVDSKPKAEMIVPGGTEGEVGGTNKCEAFDIVIKSEEQFLAEQPNMQGKRVLIKDCVITFETVDFQHAAYVEFCNAYFANATFTVSFANASIANFAGAHFSDLPPGSPDGLLCCCDINISNFKSVENVGLYQPAHHNDYLYNYYGSVAIRDCLVSNVSDCCNISNCHVVGRIECTFTNCIGISNLHGNLVPYDPDVTFKNCSHLSNIAITTGGVVTYTNCTKVSADTCDGYGG